MIFPQSLSLFFRITLCHSVSKCLSVFLSSWHYTFDIQSIFYHYFPRGLDAKDMLHFNLYLVCFVFLCVIFGSLAFRFLI